MARTIGVAIIGTGFMGSIHARAHTLVRQIFPESGAHPELRVVADIDGPAAERAAFKHSIPRWTTDWRDAVADPSVELVDISAPPFLHQQIATEAARLGKHIYCEKPVGRTLEEGLAIQAAIHAAGVQSFIGLNYRWAPAVQYARELIQSGRLGEIRDVRISFRTDVLAGPIGATFTWRFSREAAGAGALADLGAHVFDMARYLAGDIDEVLGMTTTSVPTRHDPTRPPGQQDRAVDNDDTFAALVTFKSGATGIMDASRIATGTRSDFGFTVNGSIGAVRWYFPHLNDLELYLPQEDRREQGFTRLRMAAEHPPQGSFIPSPGQPLGYPDTKVIELRTLMEALASGQPASPNIDDWVMTARALDAVPQRRWVKIGAEATPVVAS
jgi:predicted dehydrogenase